MEKNYRWVNWDNAWQSLFFVAAFVFVVFGTQFLWAEKTIDRYVLELNSSNEVKIVAEIEPNHRMFGSAMSGGHWMSRAASGRVADKPSRLQDISDPRRSVPWSSER